MPEALKTFLLKLVLITMEQLDYLFLASLEDTA